MSGDPEVLMRRLLFALLPLLLLPRTAEAALPLSRGVAIHEWLNWAPLAADGSYRWPPYRSVAEWLSGSRPAADWPKGDEFARIRAMGFDFVRLSVDPGPLLAYTGDMRQEALAVLEGDVRRVTATGLKVVFNLQAVTQVPAYGPDVVNSPADSAAIAGYEAMVADVAQMLARVGGDKVAIEPFNEPAHYPCDGTGYGGWQPIAAATVAKIRAVSRDLTIVMTGACGGDVTGLADLNPAFDDPDIYYSFHMYDPHSFTHQRLQNPTLFASGLPWPSSSGTPQQVIENLHARMTAAGMSPAAQAMNMAQLAKPSADYFAHGWGPADVRARIGEAVAWAKANGIPVTRLFMGEFGAILMSADGRQGAPDADRLRYDEVVRETAESYGIPWSLWEYSNPYGMTLILPEGPAVPDPELLRALGLREPPDGRAADGQ
jgi:hypothetical protein